MTYKELSYKICDIAIHNKLFNYALEGDVAEINSLNITEYPIFLMSGIGPHTDNGSIMRYHVVFYFFDRALNDFSNSTDAYSTGIETLKNIIKLIRNDEDIINVSDELSFYPFKATDTKVLSDNCFGVYVELDISVLNDTLCAID